MKLMLLEGDKDRMIWQNELMKAQLTLRPEDRGTKKLQVKKAGGRWHPGLRGWILPNTGSFSLACNTTCSPKNP